MCSNGLCSFSYLICFTETQCFPYVTDVIDTSQLWYTSGQHHAEKVDEEVSLLP